jgi:hypothetical protein
MKNLKSTVLQPYIQSVICVFQNTELRILKYQFAQYLQKLVPGASNINTVKNPARSWIFVLLLLSISLSTFSCGLNSPDVRWDGILRFFLIKSHVGNIRKAVIISRESQQCQASTNIILFDENDNTIYSSDDFSPTVNIYSNNVLIKTIWLNTIARHTTTYHYHANIIHERTYVEHFSGEDDYVNEAITTNVILGRKTIKTRHEYHSNPEGIRRYLGRYQEIFQGDKLTERRQYSPEGKETFREFNKYDKQGNIIRSHSYRENNSQWKPLNDYQYSYVYEKGLPIRIIERYNGKTIGEYKVQYDILGNRTYEWHQNDFGTITESFARYEYYNTTNKTPYLIPDSELFFGKQVDSVEMTRSLVQSLSVDRITALSELLKFDRVLSDGTPLDFRTRQILTFYACFAAHKLGLNREDEYWQILSSIHTLMWGKSWSDLNTELLKQLKPLCTLPEWEYLNNKVSSLTISN